MRLKDEHLCTLTDFHIHDGLEVDEPIYLEHLKRCPRCQGKIRRHRASLMKKQAQSENKQAGSAVPFSPRPADPKYWALPPRKERKKRQKKWVLVGSTAASLLLLLTGYSNNNQGASNYTNQAQANPVVTEADLDGLNNAERTILMTAAPGTRATGTLYILKTDNPDEKKLVINIRGLKPSSDHVYQVWKHEGNRVVPVGTVDPSEDGTAMFASRLSDYHSTEGITITKEKRYEKQPMGRDMLVAALSPTWEKNTFQNGVHKSLHKIAKKKSVTVSRHGKKHSQATYTSKVSNGKEGRYTYSKTSSSKSGSIGSSSVKTSRSISSTKPSSVQQPSGSSQKQQKPQTPQTSKPANDSGSANNSTPAPSNNQDNTSSKKSSRNHLLDLELDLGLLDLRLKL